MIENIGAPSVQFTSAEITELNAALSAISVQGTRLPDEVQAFSDVEAQRQLIWFKKSVQDDPSKPAFPLIGFGQYNVAVGTFVRFNDGKTRGADSVQTRLSLCPGADPTY